MLISQKAFDLIVREETGGEDYYNRTECHPTYPGGASGVTIGIGYDCGYALSSEIVADWSDKLAPLEIKALSAMSGIHGPPASSHAHELRGLVMVPWNVALDVFRTRDVPKWEKLVAGALANCDQLSGDSFGALVSLAFNRGASFNSLGDRYREMRDIAWLMRSRQFVDIPDQIRAMKRIWPLPRDSVHIDLRNRRDHEAALFEEGLTVAA